jgi:hypothetical protein
LFTKIIFENSSQYIEETTAANRNYSFRNKRWYGNFPKVNRERLVDGYLKVTFFNDSTDDIHFNEMITEVSKMI